MAERPLLAITLGDPAGIGPEIIAKSLSHDEVYRTARPLVIGDLRMLQQAMSFPGMPSLGINSVPSPAKGFYQSGTIDVLDLGNADPAEILLGQESAVAGKAAVEAVYAACDLAMAGEVNAIVTAPLNKAAMYKAGFSYPGHTELLAIRTGADKVSMLLVGPNLRVVHISTHVGLQEAIERITPVRVRQVIDIAWQACRALGIEQPRIAVAGLNPHASEGGLFGNEEATRIVPAIEAARADGLDVSDPQPPDTVFLRATKGVYDIVVAMYHDQGHIPMKLLAFDSGVNVSLGLPIIRTSVDHGTAFDIAGQGVAREESLLAAIDVANQIVAAKKRL